MRASATTENALATHKEQFLTYLRLGAKRLGLLINFHVVNGLEDEESLAESQSRH